MHSNKGNTGTMGTEGAEFREIRLGNDPEPQKPYARKDMLKYWTFIAFLFLIFYGANAGVFSLFLVSAVEDTETTLMTFGVCFLVTVLGIVGLIIWGRSTNQLGKAEEEAMIRDKNRS